MSLREVGRSFKDRKWEKDIDTRAKEHIESRMSGVEECEKDRANMIEPLFVVQLLLLCLTLKPHLGFSW